MPGLSLAASLASTEWFTAFADDRIPNQDAIALSPTIGWLMLGCVACVYLMFALQSERWRRFWLTLEDPRPIGLFRIVFAFLCICNINDLWEYFDFLFTDEGIFLSDAARQQFASGQFRGFGEGGDEPYGFFDAGGVLEYLKGNRYSLLYFWDTPRAMWIQMIAFYLVAVAFMVGWKTRLMGVLTFLLMNSFFVRNQLFWEGTELVYRVFFFYLLLARSGHAYSVDNWLRCRKLRREGRLSERDGPGGGAGLAPTPEQPRGLEAVYRLIPTWPRMLMVLNLGVLYCYTGTVKNGAVWSNGDALYYALNMDHFHRFYPQEASSILGTNLFRLATWITHWWEALFPLMIVGMITRWGIRERLAPLHGWRLWAVRGCWLGLGLLAMVVVLVAYPVHYAPRPGGASLAQTQLTFALAWLGTMAAVGLLWWALGTGRVRVPIRGTRHVLDREWFCRWFLGRRVWLTLGLMFHGNLQVLMNIGMFAPIMMSTYLFCLQGDEPGRILRFFGRGLARVGVPMPASVRRREPPLPAEDRTLPHHLRDTQRMPPALLYGLIALAAFGVFLQGGPLVPWIKRELLALTPATGGLPFAYTVGVIGVILVLATYAQGHRKTRGGALRIAAVLAAVVAYAWLMGARFVDPVEAERLKFIRVAVSLAIVAVLLLQQLPWVHRRLAALGLGFTAPSRAAAPSLPAHDPATGHAARAVGLRARRTHAGRLHRRLSHHRDRGLGAAGQGLGVGLPHQGPRGLQRLGGDDPDRPAVGHVRAQPPAAQCLHEDRPDRRSGRDLGHAQRRLCAGAPPDPVDLERPDAQDEPPHHRRGVGQGRHLSEVVCALPVPRVGPHPPRRDAREGRAVQDQLQDARARHRRPPGLVRPGAAAPRHRSRGARAHREVLDGDPGPAARLDPRAPRPPAAQGGRVQAAVGQAPEGLGAPARAAARQPGPVGEQAREQPASKPARQASKPDAPGPDASKPDGS
jgi:hypothetical protein